MKQLLFFLTFFLVLVSCENESIDNNDSEPEVLIIKQVDNVIDRYNFFNSTFVGTDYNFQYYNDHGQPYLVNENLSNGSIRDLRKYFYNDDNKIDSIWRNDGIHRSYWKYTYANNLLTHVWSNLEDSGVFDYEIIYDNNSIIMYRESYSFGEVTISRTNLVFTDNTYNTLTRVENFYNYEVDDTIPTNKIDYEYDTNGNIILINSSRINSQTGGLTLNSTTEYTYDTKHNPFSNFSNTNFLVGSFYFEPTSYNPNYRAKNNVLSEVTTYFSANTNDAMRTKTYEYEYNDSDFPINIREEWMEPLVNGGQGLVSLSNSILTYYED